MGAPLGWGEFFYVEFWNRQPWTAGQAGPFLSYESAVEAASKATWATSFTIVKRFERAGV